MNVHGQQEVHYCFVSWTDSVLQVGNMMCAYTGSLTGSVLVPGLLHNHQSLDSPSFLPVQFHFIPVATAQLNSFADLDFVLFTFWTAVSIPTSPPLVTCCGTTKLLSGSYFGSAMKCGVLRLHLS